MIDAGRCNMKCTGTANELCGGSSAMNLYTFAGATTTVVQAAGGYTHQGCYYDGANPRALLKGLTNSNSTVEAAIAACAKAGYKLYVSSAQVPLPSKAGC